MNRVTQTAAVLLCAILLAFGATGARAQAVTTSAVSGRVTGDNGQGVAAAQVTATNAETGSISRATPRSGTIPSTCTTSPTPGWSGSPPA